MVNAETMKQDAIYEGALEQKTKTGWKQQYFILTRTHWVHFESINSLSAKSQLQTIDIIRAEIDISDTTSRQFTILLYRKKKEYRAATSELRDLWFKKLSSVIGIEEIQDVIEELPLKETDSRIPDIIPQVESLSTSQDILQVDLEKLSVGLCNILSKQIQISRSVTSKDLLTALEQEVSPATTEQLVQLAQRLIDAKILVPVQFDQEPHVFLNIGERYTILGPGTLKTTKYPYVKGRQWMHSKRHIHSGILEDILNNPKFDAKKYADDFLKKHTTAKIDAHCRVLVQQNECTVEELKHDISANYTAFIRASNEVKTMDNSVSQLKTLVSQCKRSVQSLKTVQLNTWDQPHRDNKSTIAESVADRTPTFMSSSNPLILDLTECLQLYNFEEFAKLVREYIDREEQYKTMSCDLDYEVQSLVQKCVDLIVDDFTSIAHTSERVYRDDKHISLLIQLGKPSLATQLCLTNFTARVYTQLRRIPGNGNIINYVEEVARTFFTSLLVCYEDYDRIFKSENSRHYVEFTIWCSKQLEQFVAELFSHIYPFEYCDHLFSTLWMDDTADFKAQSQSISQSLRYIFYGARQLELAGIPTTHCLALPLGEGLKTFLVSYSAFIIRSVHDSIMDEKWEMTPRTIRDFDVQSNREIQLTESACKFYVFMQQYLHDLQQLLNPTCSTSCIYDVQERVLFDVENVMVCYADEVILFLEASNIPLTMEIKHYVALLTNVAHIQDDCIAHATKTLENVLPGSLLDKHNSTRLNETWKKLVAIVLKRCAKFILNTLSTLDMNNVSNEPLPELGPNIETKFLRQLVNVAELLKSNNQLDGALSDHRTCVFQRDEQVSAQFQHRTSVLVMRLVETLLNTIVENQSHLFDVSDNMKFNHHLQYTSVNQWIGELMTIKHWFPTSSIIDKQSDVVIEYITKAYEACVEGSSKQEHLQDILAVNWRKQYIQLCSAIINGK